RAPQALRGRLHGAAPRAREALHDHRLPALGPGMEAADVPFGLRADQHLNALELELEGLHRGADQLDDLGLESPVDRSHGRRVDVHSVLLALAGGSATSNVNLGMSCSPGA